MIEYVRSNNCIYILKGRSKQMIYDFRNDIKELLDSASNNDASLNQCATAIETYLNLWKHASFKQNEEVIDAQTKNTESEIKNKSEVTVLKHAEPDEDTKEAIKFPKSTIVEASKDDEELKLTARQTLAGTQLLDEDGVQRSYLNEATRRKFNITDGDIVTVKLIDGASPYIIGVENHEGSSNIETFDQAIVEQDGDDLVIRKNANGETLENITGVESYIISDSVVQSYDLKAGDIVTLAWYANAFTETARINWKFSTDIPEDEKHHKLLKKKSKDKDKSENSYKPRLDFDLNNTLIAVVTADDSVASNLSQVANAHHGILGVVSGENARNLISHLSKYGMVILLKGYINHEISGAIIRASQHGQITNKLAMANTKGQLTFEKALYRAYNNIDLDDKTSVNYPVLTD